MWLQFGTEALPSSGAACGSKLILRHDVHPAIGIVCCRSPKYWDKPEEFNPDRFPISESVPNEVTQDYAYLPFGAGRRKCIGASAACLSRYRA